MAASQSVDSSLISRRCLPSPERTGEDEPMETAARVRQIAREVLGYPDLRPGQLEAAAALADGVTLSLLSGEWSPAAPS